MPPPAADDVDIRKARVLDRRRGVAAQVASFEDSTPWSADRLLEPSPRAAGVGYDVFDEPESTAGAKDWPGLSQHRLLVLHAQHKGAEDVVDGPV
jgi:hypothetical protein